MISRATGFETNVEQGCKIDRHPSQSQRVKSLATRIRVQAEIDHSNSEANVPSAEKSFRVSLGVTNSA